MDDIMNRAIERLSQSQNVQKKSARLDSAVLNVRKDPQDAVMVKSPKIS